MPGLITSLETHAMSVPYFLHALGGGLGLRAVACSWQMHGMGTTDYV